MTTRERVEEIRECMGPGVETWGERDAVKDLRDLLAYIDAQEARVRKLEAWARLVCGNLERIRGDSGSDYRGHASSMLASYPERRASDGEA